MKDFAKDLVKDIVIAAAIAGAILFFIRPTIVKQTSMQNTMNPNDYLIMYKRAYIKKMPSRGDIIIFKSNMKDDNGKTKLLIKRAIGLPGDDIKISGGKVYINGKIYEESYLKDGITPGEINTKVPKNKLFVMGDNRVASLDSRYPEVGFVSKKALKGKVIIRLFPFDEIQRF